MAAFMDAFGLGCLITAPQVTSDAVKSQDFVALTTSLVAS